MSMPGMRRWSAVGVPRAGHPAPMDATTLAAARIRGFLDSEPVVWMSTVRPDGGPHIIPIWFSWDGDALVVFSKPGAQKVRNLQVHPEVMLALGDPDDDFDVGLLEGRAELLDPPAAAMAVIAPHIAKYRRRMTEIGLSPAEFVETYSQVIRITPTRFLPWHGRTAAASRPGSAIDRLKAWLAWLGSGFGRQPARHAGLA